MISTLLILMLVLMILAGEPDQDPAEQLPAGETEDLDRTDED